MLKVRGETLVVIDFADVQPQLVMLTKRVSPANLGLSLVIVSTTTSLAASKLTPKKIQ